MFLVVFDVPSGLGVLDTNVEHLDAVEFLSVYFFFEKRARKKGGNEIQSASYYINNSM